MAAIAFLGLGNMGGPMAKNLLAAGHDRSPSLIWSKRPVQRSPLRARRSLHLRPRRQRALM